MKHCLYISILLLTSLSWVNRVSGQSLTIGGTVVDPAGEPLELANVFAEQRSGDRVTIHSFAITDATGHFQLDLPRDSTFVLKASYLGYLPWEQELVVTAETTDLRIALAAGTNNLETVTVTHRLPVSVSGDTVSYRAEAFATGQERKLKDLFERIPGFAVSDNGNVTVNGQRVEQIKVEGKSFFDGDSKLATENIPADAVDQVDVLRDHAEFAQLKGVGAEDGLAIDIRLKADKQRIVFGSLQGGGGPQDRYAGHANLFYFSPKTSLNFIGDLNNIGDQVFTLQDFFRFNGGVKNAGQETGSSLRLSPNMLGLMAGNRSRFFAASGEVGALNFSHEPNEDWSVSGFAILSRQRTETEASSVRTYLQSNADNVESLESTGSDQDALGIGQLRVDFTPSEKLAVRYVGMGKVSTVRPVRSFVSTIAAATSRFEQDFSTRSPDFSQEVAVHYTAADRHIFSLTGQQQLGAKHTRHDLAADVPLFADFYTADDSLAIMRIDQEREITTQRHDWRLAYHYLLNRTNQLQFGVGQNFLNQDLRNRIALNQQVAESPGEPATLTDYRFRDSYASIAHRIRLGKLRLRQGAILHSFLNENTQSAGAISERKWLLLPQFDARYDFRKSVSLSLDYRIHTQWNDVEQLAADRRIDGYNSIFRGNPALSNAWFHDLKLSFYYFSLFNFTNFYAGLSFKEEYRSIGSTFEFAGLERFKRPLNLEFPNRSLTGFWSYDRRFSHFRIAFSGDVNLAEYAQVIDEIPVTSTNLYQNYRGSIETRAENFPVIEIGLETRLNRYQNSLLDPRKFRTYQPFINGEIGFLKHFLLTFEYEHVRYRNPDTELRNNFDFWNAALYFDWPGLPLELNIRADNLLNTREICRDRFTEVLIHTSCFRQQQRYFVCSLKYEL